MACCERAREIGIGVGMPLAEVTALQKQASSKRSGRRGKTQIAADLLVHAYQPASDKQALEALAVWCEQFSPLVGLEDEQHPSSLLLDVTGLSPLFGGESRFVSLVVQAFRQRGYEVRVAVAGTVGAAWALAHYGTNPACEKLGALPLEALRLSPDVIATLRQLGVQTIDSLLQLPRQGLATRLGKTVLQRIDQLLGKQPEVIVVHRSSPSFEATWDLEHPTDRRKVIEEILLQLTIQVARDLSLHDHAAVQAEAVLQGGQFLRRLPVSLFQPSSHSQHLFELFQLSLETVQMRERIEKVSVAAVTTVRIRADQQTLWEEVGDGRRDIAMLVDRLSSRLGRENVFGVSAQAGSLPEKAYRKNGLTVNLKRRQRAASQNKESVLPRPLWLQNPEPLQLLAIKHGEKLGDLPGAFRFQNVCHEVKRHWGPERIETGWWQGQSVRRDYYRVETHSGYRFWLFQRLTDGNWFLHGCFD